MPFPSLQPTSRAYDGGNYPVRTYKAQSGVEARILYGSRRTGMTLTLNFDNITDAQAEQFLDHYDETKGTYLTFTLPSIIRAGWAGNSDAIDVPTGNGWRYEGPPSVTNVRPGISSVAVKLVGVL
jgi:hypothetical protein